MGASSGSSGSGSSASSSASSSSVVFFFLLLPVLLVLSCSFLFFLVLSCSFLFFFHLVLLVVLQTLLRRLFPELCFELFLELVFCFELVSFELNISEPPLTLINDYFEHSLYDQVRARRRRRRRGRLGRQHSRHSWRDAFSAHDAIPSAASPPPYQQ